MISRALTALSLVLLATPAMADNAPSLTPATPTPPPAWTPKDGDEISFQVLREGKPFGTHTVSFDVAPDGTLKATTDVRLKAGLGPITLFRYALDATETWKDGQLVALKGAVDDNGDDGSVSAMRVGNALDVTGTEYTGRVPFGILPSSHWNVAQTQASQLLSSEDGELIEVNVVDKGPDTVSVGDTSVEANRYLMDSDIDVDLWYDEQGRWVKLAFEARGQLIEYVLTKPF
tara:strand:- start:277 stop:972 length:696 start_codon:yes stop_codon:yes gene_type:complete